VERSTIPIAPFLQKVTTIHCTVVRAATSQNWILSIAFAALGGLAKVERMTQALGTVATCLYRKLNSHVLMMQSSPDAAWQ
jgi:hypothetical protein